MAHGAWGVGTVQLTTESAIQPMAAVTARACTWKLEMVFLALLVRDLQPRCETALEEWALMIRWWRATVEREGRSASELLRRACCAVARACETP